MEPIIAQPTNLWLIDFPYNVDYVAHKSVIINNIIIMFYVNATPI